MQQQPMETEKVPLRPDSMCQLEFVGMEYGEAREIMSALECTGTEHDAQLSVSISGAFGSCEHIYQVLGTLKFNVLFGYISFRDALEIVNAPCVREFLNTSVRVKTAGSGRGYSTVFEGTMSDLAEYTIIE